MNEYYINEIKIAKTKLEIYQDIYRILKECSPEVIKVIIEGRIEAYIEIINKLESIDAERNIL